MVGHRVTRDNYKDIYLVGRDEEIRRVPLHMWLAFFMLKANMGSIFGGKTDQYRTHLLHENDSKLLMEPQDVVNKLVNAAEKYEISDCCTPPGYEGLDIKSAIIRDSLHLLAMQVHDRGCMNTGHLPIDCLH